MLLAYHKLLFIVVRADLDDRRFFGKLERFSNLKEDLFLHLVFVLALVLAALPFVNGSVKLLAVQWAGLDTDTIPEQLAVRSWLRVYADAERYAPASIGAGSTDDDHGVDLYVRLYYQALNSGDNMFMADTIAAAASYETAVLEVDGWYVCKRPAVVTLHPLVGLLELV